MTAALRASLPLLSVLDLIWCPSHTITLHQACSSTLATLILVPHLLYNCMLPPLVVIAVCMVCGPGQRSAVMVYLA